MRRVHGAAAALLCMLGTGAIGAELRVAYVNMAKVLEDAPQATEASAKLEQSFSPREREIVALKYGAGRPVHVLVERVEGYCTEAAWMRAYAEINQFERQLVDFGAILFKFWVNITREEQLRRRPEVSGRVGALCFCELRLVHGRVSRR